jgi:hypothetical protein
VKHCASFGGLALSPSSQDHSRPQTSYSCKPRLYSINIKKNNFDNAAILPDADRAVNMEYAGSTPFSTA